MLGEVLLQHVAGDQSGSLLKARSSCSLPGILLDRDGTVIVDHGSVGSVDRVDLIEGRRRRSPSSTGPASRSWWSRTRPESRGGCTGSTTLPVCISASQSVWHRDLGGVSSEQPSAGGVVDLEATGTIIGFVEKPSEPVSGLTNAGMYAFDPSVLDEIDGMPPKDIGDDLLPRLVGRARAVLVEWSFRDVGIADAYRRAREEWPARAS